MRSCYTLTARVVLQLSVNSKCRTRPAHFRPLSNFRQVYRIRMQLAAQQQQSPARVFPGPGPPRETRPVFWGLVAWARGPLAGSGPED